MYDIVNIGTSCTNNVILFFWINNKVEHSKNHLITNNMIKLSSLILFVFYLIFAIISYFYYKYESVAPRFLICNDLTILYYNNLFAYLIISSFILSGLLQLIAINFYFIIIKSVILRSKTSSYFSGKR